MTFTAASDGRNTPDETSTTPGDDPRRSVFLPPHQQEDDDYPDSSDDDYDDEDDFDDDLDDDEDDDDGDDHDLELSYSLIVTGSGLNWVIKEIDSTPPASINAFAQAIGRQRSEGAAFGIICQYDQYFIIVRPSPSGIKVLLSDATMSVEDDIAADAMDEIGAEIPDIDAADLDDIEPWAEGDMEILADLGVSAQVMAVICDDTEIWATEQLQRIGEEVGFVNDFNEFLDLDS